MIDDFNFLRNPVSSSMKYILSQWDPNREQVLGVVDVQERQIYYRPLAHMVYDFCYTFFKNKYWQYHLFNLFFFVLASSLVYLFIESITGNFNLALLSGFFYLIHPVNGVIVNYISASVFAFQVIFTLGTILLLLGALDRMKDRGLYFLSLLFCSLSLFWHESGAMTPLYIAAVVFFFRKDPLKDKILYLCPYFLIILSYVVFRCFFININDTVVKQMASVHMTGWEFAANLFQVFSWYIVQLFYPQGIVLMWSAPFVHDHLLWPALGAAAMAVTFLSLFIRFKNNSIVLLALAWFCIGFAPACLTAFRLPPDGVTIEPHWFVVSSVGYFILAAYLCLFFQSRAKKTGIVFLCSLIFIWGGISHANNLLWANQKTYALYWLKQAPYLKWTNFYLADAYQTESSFTQARAYYKRSLSGTLMDIRIYNNLGTMDLAEGHLKEAELNFKKALKIYPYSALALNNLGIVFLDQGRLELSGSLFRQALAYNPLMTEPRVGLASIFLKNSEYRQAIDLCLLNLRIKSNDINTLSLLINIYLQQQDLVNIKKWAPRLIRAESDPEDLINMGLVMAHYHFPVIALDCFIKALKINPKYKDAYLRIGELFFETGRNSEALRIWKTGLSIDPLDQRFKVDIAKIVK